MQQCGPRNIISSGIAVHITNLKYPTLPRWVALGDITRDYVWEAEMDQEIRSIMVCPHAPPMAPQENWLVSTKKV